MAIAGCIALAMVAGSVILGYLLTSGGPFSILDLNHAPAAAVITGTTGLTPGGPGLQASLLISGPATGPATISAISPDAVSLPAACPPEAWNVSPVAPAQLTARTSDVHLSVTVALTDDAPAGCQGAVVPVLTADITAAQVGGDAVTLRSSLEAPVTVATLGTPGVAVEDQSGQAVIITTPGAAAPGSVHYIVESSDAAGAWTIVCQLAEPVPCATGHRPGNAAVHYRVTAYVGSSWRRTSATIGS